MNKPGPVDSQRAEAETAYRARSGQIAGDLHATRQDFRDLLTLADQAGADEFDTATVLMERSEEDGRAPDLRAELATMAMLLMQLREDEGAIERDLPARTLDDIRRWYALGQLCGKDRVAQLDRMQAWAQDARFPQIEAHRLASFVESQRTPAERFAARTQSIARSPLASAAEIQAWYDLGQAAGVPVADRILRLMEWEAEGGRNVSALERITLLIDEADASQVGTYDTPGIRRTLREYAPVDSAAAGGLTSGRKTRGSKKQLQGA